MTGGAFGDIEPISRFHEAFQGSVDAAYAAAVVGLETNAFRQKIRENVGLQNAGLLVLDSPNGSMKRDAWTDSFGDIIFALDFPESFTTPTGGTPTTPGAVVRIPDPNLRAVIAEELGKSPNAPITVEEMERLREIDARKDRGIKDLTGLQYATNLVELYLGWYSGEGNQVSDLSPVAGLTNLRVLFLHHNPVSDISPVRGLTNLTELMLYDTLISDISPVKGLINLTRLHFHGTEVTDLSPISGLINLKNLAFSNGDLSDISPVAGLINLEWIFSWDHSISDLSPLAGLPKLKEINFCGGNISDLTPLAGLPNLKELYLAGEDVSDISPIARLTGLTRLDLHSNNISDISALAGLTNLKWLFLEDNDISDVSPILVLPNLTWLNVGRNNISDLSPLERLRANNVTVLLHGNPAIPKGGPKIEGPWLWVLLSGPRLGSGGADLLSKASGGEVTENQIATHGATAGQPVGDTVWVSHLLPSEPQNNIGDMLGHDPPDGTIYGTVSVYSPREQETTLHVGADDELKVWLNGVVVYENFEIWGSGDYTDFAPVTLRAGKNILLVAVGLAGRIHNGKFGFKPGTEYTASTPGVSYTFSLTPIHTGDTFTLDIGAKDVFDLAGWQFDIAFERNALEAINIIEGDFLKQNGASTFFQGGSINNGTGKITGLNVVRLATSGVSGSGTVVQVSFKTKRGGETVVELQNFQFATITGDIIPAGPHKITIAIEGQLAAGDVNRDGQVTIADLILVAGQLGQRVSLGSLLDLNGDGVVSMLDLLIVAQAIGAPAAPSVATEPIDPATIASWIAQGQLEDDGSLGFQQGIENLQALLRSLTPKETTLLANYPNPFNPETWIPYHLSTTADVKLTIYNSMGVMIRQFDLGHQAAGYYTDRTKATYWDGRNEFGEPVGSGVYFYHLSAGEYSATKKMVILK